MQSFDTSAAEPGTPEDEGHIVIVARVEDIPLGCSVRIGLSNGAEIAVFNVDGEFYATNNFCPHKGAPLSEGTLCGHIIECDWHGWQFDVRSGECLTIPEQLTRYRVVVAEGLVKVVLTEG